MIRNRLFLKVFILAFCTLPFAPAAFAQATRTWVSGVGDDVNPCSRTAPCKTFAGAISKTAAGGIIDVLDSGGFGAVTITKSITIDGSGGSIAGVLVSGTNAIVVSGAGINVILRNLDIEGIGTGLVGVNFLAGSSLDIEHCRIFGFQAGSATGIRMSTSTGGKLTVSDTDLVNNGTGIHVDTTGGQLAFVTLDNVRAQNSTGNGFETAGAGLVFASVKRSLFNHNGADGVRAASSTSTVSVVDSAASLNSGTGVSAFVSGARVRVSGNAILNNATGLNLAAGATIESDGTNRIAGFNASATPNATFNNQ
jgi:parallel beta helix pectate lyase-like protein